MSGTQSSLWAVSSSSNVYRLPVGGREWEHVSNQHGLGMRGFKKVVALPDSVWGLGCDHQVYVLVHGSEIPIRLQEATLENERWIPVKGWSSKHLLPIDPKPWTSLGGDCPLPRESVSLPSENWAWEEPWYVDENVDGFITEKGGWQYAGVDFHQTFHPNKKRGHCVRRRKWIRHMVFQGCDKWARVTSIHLNPLEEPIVDIGVGGHLMANTPDGHKSVWVVTIEGKVYYRADVRQHNPEGNVWDEIRLGPDQEVLNISVSPYGLVWAVTWSGQAIIRVGISWQCPMGTDWVSVEPCDDGVTLTQVIVGERAVWAIGNDEQLYFRKGIDAVQAASDLDAAVGTAWMPLVSSMKTLSIGPNDQVYGIDKEQHLYFKTGIASGEPTGKAWKKITPQLPEPQESDTDSITTYDSQISDIVDSCLPHLARMSNAEAKKSDHNWARSDGTGLNTQSTSDLSSPSTMIPAATASKSATCDFQSMSYSTLKAAESDTDEGLASASVNTRTGEFSVSFTKANNGGMPKRTPPPRPTSPPSRGKYVNFSSTDGNHSNQGSVQSLDHLVPPRGFLKNYDDDSLLGSMCSLDSEITLNQEPVEGDTLMWVSVSGTSCSFMKESDLAEWFKTESSRSHRLFDRLSSQPSWRGQILQQLKVKNQSNLKKYSHHELAIDRQLTSNVKRGKMKLWRDMHSKPRWVDCDIELITDETEHGSVIGTLTIQYQHKRETKGIFVVLDDIACIHCTTKEIVQPEISILTHKRLNASPRGQPIKLAAISEDSLYEWIASLNVACSEGVGVLGSPLPEALWSVTDRGEVFIHNINPLVNEPSQKDMYWQQVGGYMKQVETNSAGVTWGIAFDGTAYVHTGGYGGSLFKGMASPTGIHTLVTTREVCVYEYQRWTPVSGFSDRSLPMDGPMWRDETGKACTKDDVKLVSKHHQWVSEWTLDFSAPGKVDKEGWQYSTDFYRQFHGRKKLRDYVRRRKWIRKYQVATSGPWEEVGPVKLQDISLQLDPSEFSTKPMACWAVGANGDVLCRIDVTRDNHKGTCWQHIPTDQPFRAVTVGKDLHIWATAKDGSAWLRAGVTGLDCAGVSWLQVSPPRGSKFQQISAGEGLVLAIDQNDQLWIRTGVSHEAPEGLKWERMTRHVKHVSIGPKNQVWCIVNKIASVSGQIDGVVCKCPDLDPKDPSLCTWQPTIGPGWCHVTARGSNHH